jgi:hypothetical protein
MGPATVQGINMLAPETLLFTFVELAKRYFIDLVAVKPKNAQWLKGWTNRAKSWMAA